MTRGKNEPEDCNQPSTEVQGKVGAALTSDENFNLLRRVLAPAPLDVRRIDNRNFDKAAVDILVVDPTSLDSSRESICRLRREASPVVFPVLLLAPQGQRTSRVFVKELGPLIDDVLRIPATTDEIRARVANLLRLRELSLGQQRRHSATRQVLTGLSRALRTLHACNELMVRETTEDGLLEGVCRTITGDDGYALAWVGFVESPVGGSARKRISRAAIAGAAAEYARGIALYVGEPAEVQGPAARAIVDGKTQIIADLATDASVAPWRKAMDAWSLRSVITLPLQPRQGAPGVLCVYSTQLGDFGDDVRELLERLAANLVFGIEKLRMEREQRRQADEIQRLAYQDPLTELPNRRFLLEQFDGILQATARGELKAAAVLFVDINNFKLVNDALGHAAGDTMLQRIGQRICRSVRDGDWVIRQGGDEFIVLMYDDPRHRPVETDYKAREHRLAGDAESLAHRILRALRDPFAMRGFDHRIGASIGISLFPYLSDDLETVISQADMAMYRAKQAGRGIAFYTPDTTVQRQHRFSLEARLHHALEHEEFTLHYQPLWEIANTNIIGVEALLRWTDGEGRHISPAEFIPLAEEIGLIDPIGEWVLATAAQQLARWDKGGLQLTMAVNLAISQLQRRDAAAHILKLATASGTQPQWWSLEVTEDLLMRDVDTVEAVMRRLNGEGFRFALDDFGRGYSSLTRLKSLPLETLKIDKFFVDTLGDDDESAAIITTIIDLARNLSMRTLAEGIETVRQRQCLEGLGCQLGQGFWISAARPPEEIPALVARSRVTT